MARVKRGFKARRRHNRVLKQTAGYFGTRHSRIKQATEVLHKAWAYGYFGRKRRKRDFRRLWITRIGAAAKQNGISYSKLLGGLRRADVALDRKILSDLAVHEPAAFAAVVHLVKSP